MFRKRLLSVLVLTLTLVVSGCPPIDQIDAAIEQLRSTARSVEDIARILEELQRSLDEGELREQVQQIAGTIGQAAQVTGQAYFDFFRARVREGLLDIRAQAEGKPPAPRVPVLANAGYPPINFNSTSRAVMPIVGWNLDVAAANPTRYNVVVENPGAPAPRGVERTFITFQSQYQLTLNVSSNGIPLQTGDTKIVFNGYEQPFELPIINSGAGQRFTALRLESVQDQDNKDGDIKVQVRLIIDGTTYVDVQVGKHDTWDDATRIRMHIIPQQDPSLRPCWFDFRLPSATGTPSDLRRRVTDGSCHYRLVQAQLPQLPERRGQLEGELTIDTLDDNSGWGAHFVLTGILPRPPGNTQPPEERLLLQTDSYLFNRGNPGNKRFPFKW